MLAERFCARWRVAGVAAPPPAAPAYAAARPASFVLCHRLAGKESLASLAVRYGCDTVELKRLNNLLSDNALACRWAGGAGRGGGGERSGTLLRRARGHAAEALVQSQMVVAICNSRCG